MVLGDYRIRKALSIINSHSIYRGMGYKRYPYFLPSESLKLEKFVEAWPEYGVYGPENQLSI